MTEVRSTLLVAEADESTRVFLAEQLTADRYEVMTASEPAQVGLERWAPLPTSRTSPDSRLRPALVAPDRPSALGSARSGVLAAAVEMLVPRRKQEPSSKASGCCLCSKAVVCPGTAGFPRRSRSC